MQPFGHRRRNWNWARVAKKARGGAVAMLASVPLLVFISLVYAVMLVERLFSRRYRDGPAVPKFTNGSTGTGRIGPAGASRRQRGTLVPGLPRPAGMKARETTTPQAEHDQRRGQTEAAEEARAEADRAIASNLALCISPAAVVVVAEEAVLRHELYWPMLETVFARLIDLSATSGDVRTLMRMCGYEWLYEMDIAPRRFVRLKAQASGGGLRWRHLAIRLICFELDGGMAHSELLPPFDILHSQTRIFVYFDDEDQVLGWERPLEPRRRHL
ncbi:MAG: hypothetical protein KJ587_11550 [Alphaproteobacteria bacterium]|nr:hypothetical protein [Alphaproteobacteria bacterium]